MLGDLSCTLVDATECKIVSVAMVDKEDGDFRAEFDNPTGIQADAGSVADRLYNNNFKLWLDDELDFVQDQQN
jgi:hypothetical protein